MPLASTTPPRAGSAPCLRAGFRTPTPGYGSPRRRKRLTRRLADADPISNSRWPSGSEKAQPMRPRGCSAGHASCPRRSPPPDQALPVRDRIVTSMLPPDASLPRDQHPIDGAAMYQSLQQLHLATDLPQDRRPRPSEARRSARRRRRHVRVTDRFRRLKALPDAGGNRPKLAMQSGVGAAERDAMTGRYR